MGIRLSFCGLLLMLASRIAGADLAPDELRELAAQLDHDEFAVREAASQKLLAAGPAAIDTCLEAAQGDSYETSYRAVEVLKKLRSRFATRQVADDALRKLADSGHQVASRLANDVYEAERPAPLPSQPPRSLQRRFQAAAIAQANRLRIATRVINGDRHVEASEGNRTVVIDQTAEGAISMSVTQANGNASVTQKYAAKDTEELRKLHPQAYVLYLRYAGRAGVVGVRNAQRLQLEAMRRQAEQVRGQSDQFERIRAQQRQSQIELFERLIELHERQGRADTAKSLKQVLERLKAQ